MLGLTEHLLVLRADRRRLGSNSRGHRVSFRPPERCANRRALIGGETGRPAGFFVAERTIRGAREWGGSPREAPAPPGRRVRAPRAERSRRDQGAAQEMERGTGPRSWRAATTAAPCPPPTGRPSPPIGETAARSPRGGARAAQA